MSLYSATRWWSKWEMMHQIFFYFNDVEPQPFLNENEDMAPATRGKLLGFFSDLNTKVVLQIELAAIIKATYKLEGNGSLSHLSYEVIDTIRAPNLYT